VARLLRWRMARWVYVLADQSLLMAPIEALIKALTEVWATLAEPVGLVGTEVF